MTMERHVDWSTGLDRWDLPDGRYVLADSSIDGGGIRVMRADGAVALVWGEEAVAEIVGADHPAIVLSREMTASARRAQRASGRVLSQILRDGRRYR